MLLEGKTVVISGAGEGLGQTMAEMALRDGANVVLGARNGERLAAMAQQIDPDGKRVAQQATDITDAGQCEALAALAEERFGTIDALVNVAALDTLMGGLDGANFDEWRGVFEVNVFGTMQMTRAAVPQLKKQGGSIVLIGSQSSYWPPVVTQTAYAASKGALTAGSFYLAQELGAHRIRVNTVVPTWMWGPEVEGYVNWQASEDKVTPEEVIGRITANMYLDEIPTIADVADAVMFLASDRARMITGQALFVNAGEYVRY